MEILVDARLVLSRSFAGAAEIPGGAEHPRTPLALEGALQVPEEAERIGEVRTSEGLLGPTIIICASWLNHIFSVIPMKVKHQCHGTAEPSHSLSEKAPCGVPPLSRM